MEQALEDIDVLTCEERPRIWRYSYAAGPFRSRFLLHLRDDKKIMGTICPTCGRVYVPARSTCVKCFESMEEWVQVSDEGLLETFTVVHASSPVYPEDRPFAFGIIRLDGADTGLVHRLGEIDFEKIRIGMRLRAVFEDKRRGDIRDIKCFKPVS